MKTAPGKKIGRGNLNIGRKFIVLPALLLLPFMASAQQKGKSTPSADKTSTGPAPLVIKEVPQIPSEGLVAKIGKGGLTKSEYDFYLLRFARKSGKKVAALSPEERKKALSEGLDDEIIFQAALADGALNDSYIRFMMSSLYRSNKTVATIDPRQFTEAELRAYYDAHRKEFCEPAESCIKGAKFNSKIKAADFAKSVRQSKNPSASSEWMDLGWVKEGKVAAGLPAELCDKIAKLKKGQVSDAIPDPLSRASGIFYVFLSTDSNEPRQIPYEEAQGKVKFALINQKQKENYESLLKKMGFDPKKMSEEDALFLSALNGGMHRDISVRERCINTYISKKKASREQLLADLKKKYSVTLLEGAK